MGAEPTSDIADIAPDEVMAAPDVLAFTVAESEAGQRLDVAAAQVAKRQDLVLSRTRLQSLIGDGLLLVDGTPVLDVKRKLREGEQIALVVPAAVDADPQGEPIPLDVVFEDAHLIVIDKPAGLVVHPAPGHASGTLVNALIAHCGESLSGIGGVRRPGIVHRIDKDTSGLLVVAKTDAAHRGLSALFADHGRTMPLTRGYLAFVWGELPRPAGTIEAPVGRHPNDRLRMAVVPEDHGRFAITHWRLQERYGANASLVGCTLETGRTHQIRVHMAHVGHPVMGDPLYAKGFRTKASKLPETARACLERLDRQALHAASLGFEHPITGELLEFDSPLPPDLLALQTSLESAV